MSYVQTLKVILKEYVAFMFTFDSTLDTISKIKNN